MSVKKLTKSAKIMDPGGEGESQGVAVNVSIQCIYPTRNLR